MSGGNLTTNIRWGDLEKRCRDNFRRWNIDDFLLPSFRNSVDISAVTIEFMHRGEWHSATCNRWQSDARRNFHALVLAFEAVRKADQRGIAGVFADVASAIALPAPASSAHQILGVETSATESEIRTAYRTLLKRHHPDHGGHPEEFTKIRDAGRALGVTT